MNKSEVVARYAELVSELQLPSSKVVLSAGAALVVLGLRETTKDLDVDIPAKDFYKHLGNKRVIVNSSFSDHRYAYNNFVDVHILNNELMQIVREGVWIYTPMMLLIQKKWLANIGVRSESKIAQDLIDIEKLDNYLLTA